MVQNSKNIPWTACLMEAYPNVTRHCTKKSDPSRFTGEVLVPLRTLLKLVVRKTKEESNAITYNQNAIKIHMLYICIYLYSGQSYLSNNNSKNRNTNFLEDLNIADTCDVMTLGTLAPTVH